MTNLAFYAKDKDDRALFLVRFYEIDGKIKSSTTYVHGDNDHSDFPTSTGMLRGWAAQVLSVAQYRVTPRTVHHYEVVDDD